MAEVKFEKISPADFFYRNRDIAGFTNPSRSLYTSIRELVENSLDACEVGRILPEIIVELREVGEGSSEDVRVFRLRVKDNGIGVDAEHIPHAFATVFYGSKYGYRQSRGTFGLGGTMALLYGQITTNKPVTVISCTDNDVHEFVLRIDIVENKPIVLDHKVHENSNNWRGTIIDYYLEADYTNSKAKIVEYFRNTAMANPSASLMFIDPKGRLYYFPRIAEKVPEPPKEALPHPVGVDVETMKRLISGTKSETLLSFLTSNFQRVGPKTAKEVLESATLSPTINPKELNHEQLTALVEAIKRYKKFRAPDPTPLSPIGRDLLEAGIKAILMPEFLYVVQRPPQSYSGFPFIVEAAVAYGGKMQPSEDIRIYRFANKIPLIYDERADVVWKVVSERIDWSNYNVPKGAPLAVVTHICSLKVPYKTVGKEAIADRPEIEHELTIAIRECARVLKHYLIKVERRAITMKKLNIYAKYLPKIARFSAELIDRKEPPDITKLLEKIGVTPEILEKIKLEEQEGAI
ncbi:MAG: DNA topoisomerase VI subunit B [Nitrososphaerota archaeon]